MIKPQKKAEVLYASGTTKEQQMSELLPEWKTAKKYLVSLGLGKLTVIKVENGQRRTGFSACIK